MYHSWEVYLSKYCTVPVGGYKYCVFEYQKVKNKRFLSDILPIGFHIPLGFIIFLQIGGTALFYRLSHHRTWYLA